MAHRDAVIDGDSVELLGEAARRREPNNEATTKELSEIYLGPLIDAGIAPESDDPPRPWHRVRGNLDSSTMWYAVLRKRTNGIFIGTLVFRHSDHHASLLTEGWEEVDVDAIRDVDLQQR